jgi:very-short-patch-repair endonuclease
MVYQLCGIVHPGRAERAFDAAWSRRLLSVSSSRACLLDLAKRGRNGTRVFRAILDARSDKDAAPGSGLESRVMQLAERAGIKLRRQVNSGADRWTARVDFRGVGVPFVLEVQSELHHLALSDERDDAERHAQLLRDGFEFEAVWDVDVWTNPEKVIAIIEAGVARAQQK